MGKMEQIEKKSVEEVEARFKGMTKEDLKNIVENGEEITVSTGWTEEEQLEVAKRILESKE